MEIRAANLNDLEGIWPIFAAVARAGDTFPHAPDTTREQARDYWFGPGVRTYVAEVEGDVAGAYYVRPNQVGLGSHVCNAGFIVAPARRGQGIGRALGEHAIREARQLGYQAMQFNLVVSTNQAGVALWKNLGFQTVGTVPKAFNHLEHGLVDAYIMHRFLE